ncbi:MAG TPA: MBL fold metallo-hydrolase [Candidatus Lachnoclostridium stercorigallinarum]|uniref:MBL fold metallo-hydrolase n=1 Tax=Candidatus Lachnoclostridium stercorigallinarum TaxID=2838634 RepID=A0A9D2K7H5_9FIRM|nr:MBL fold metallo-hydrolase [Candidatus Lachnoclostridium stercorigallinarum]
MAFRCTKPTPHPVKTLAYEPWEIAVKPFQVAPQTWYVSGQTWVGCYLIDTGDGLILIDTAIPESLYLMVDSICQLGFKLTDIKKILLSHAHFDHCGAAAAMKKLTGAELYMSREDTEFYKACPEETLVLDPDSHPQHFEVDKYYSDDEPITLGNVSIRTILTPGHTIGCTSFLWEVKNPANGETYVVGMHGGVGANTMNDDYYSTSKYLTPDLRERFINDADKLKKIHVDIALPSHPNQIEIVDRAGQYTDESQPYLDDTIWADFIDERVRQVKALMK